MINYDVTALNDLAAGCEKILIVGHVHPDGDCIGAALSLGMAYKMLKKDVYVCLEEYSERFDVIPGKELLYKGGDIEADMAIAVDCSTEDRLGVFLDLYNRAGITVNIDHHIGNTNYAMKNFVYDSASSSCEVIYHMINNWVLIDEKIASAIYAGIVSDTGGFRHGCTSPEVHRLTADLLELHFPFTEIYDKLMRERALAEARALAAAIQNIKIRGKVCYTFLSKNEIDRLSVSSKGLGEVIDYIFMIKGVEVAVFLYETEESQIRVSMRSKDANVNETALSLGGGGHKLAAGCTLYGSLEEAAETVLGKLKVWTE